MGRLRSLVFVFFSPFFLAPILFASSLVCAAASPAADGLLGSWRFASMRYQGRPMDPPNPDLLILFEFFDDGTDRLFWSRAGEKGFCERRARFTASADAFTELITWVNPRNNPDCARDPDMRLGRETVIGYRLVAGKLEIDAGLGGEVLTYIWERR